MHRVVLCADTPALATRYAAVLVSASLNALASADFKLNLLQIASCTRLSSNCTLKEADSRIQTFILLLYVF
ncbi:hypothetical protein DKX38_020167 [Salix brachista]|uniref:Uncharacterized protein n=1 Tax=Salix brachista TaxID=2182728 RepID=A0A5N5KIK4_9ROSI|nr:hypothetical protein DKX38_020167 [Salix brachista]